MNMFFCLWCCKGLKLRFFPHQKSLWTNPTVSMVVWGNIGDYLLIKNGQVVVYGQVGDLQDMWFDVGLIVLYSFIIFNKVCRPLAL